ncbi:hypothetical protein D3C80_1829670 [compost metagenome]
MAQALASEGIGLPVLGWKLMSLSWLSWMKERNEPLESGPTVRNVSGKLSMKRLRVPPGSALGEAKVGSVSLVSHLRSAGRLAAHTQDPFTSRKSAPIHLILFFMFDFQVWPLHRGRLN